MMTTNKKFIVKTEDSFGEKTFETVKGLCEIKNLGAYRRYFYEGKHGECEIIFVDNVLSIVRKGLFNNSFEINFDGEKNEFVYEIEMLRQVLYSLGEQLAYDEKNKIFSFSYRLFDENNIELNKLTISIKEI